MHISRVALWVGLMAVVLFSVQLGWLPSNGSETVGQPLTGFHLLADRASYMVLPSLALSSFFIAVYARLTRAAMLEVQNQDFMRTVAAKGLHPVTVQTRHALRNGLTPVTTMAAVQLGARRNGRRSFLSSSLSSYKRFPISTSACRAGLRATTSEARDTASQPMGSRRNLANAYIER